MRDNVIFCKLVSNLLIVHLQMQIVRSFVLFRGIIDNVKLAKETLIELDLVSNEVRFNINIGKTKCMRNQPDNDKIYDKLPVKALTVNN